MRPKAIPKLERHSVLRDVRRVVVKVGTALSYDPRRGIDARHLRALAGEIAWWRRKGVQTVLVASGAIGAGMAILGLRQRPKRLRDKQATAAVGQAYLMELLRQAFAKHALNVGQVLLTRRDIEGGSSQANARATLETLLRMGVVPIINENDTVAIEEIKFGGNDPLAAQVSTLVDADLLLILTDVDGLFTGDPRRDARATRVPLLVGVSSKWMQVAKGRGSVVGTGGMLTKLQSARQVNALGVHVAIARGSKRQVMTRVLQGKDEGTLFVAPGWVRRNKRMRRGL